MPKEKVIWLKNDSLFSITVSSHFFLPRIYVPLWSLCFHIFNNKSFLEAKFTTYTKYCMMLRDRKYNYS